MAETVVVAQTKSLMKNWKHYMFWWCIWMGLGGMTQPVATEDGTFWMVKAIQLAWGVAFGMVCAIIFTIGQNTLNVARKKWLSWVIALVVWMGMKFAVAGATGQFHL